MEAKAQDTKEMIKELVIRVGALALIDVKYSKLPNSFEELMSYSQPKKDSK